MLLASRPSAAEAVKLFRSSTWKMPAADKSKRSVASNSLSAVRAPSSAIGVGTAIGIGRKFAPEISITGDCETAAPERNRSSEAISVDHWRGMGLTVGTPGELRWFGACYEDGRAAGGRVPPFLWRPSPHCQTSDCRTLSRAWLEVRLRCDR